MSTHSCALQSKETLFVFVRRGALFHFVESELYKLVPDIAACAKHRRSSKKTRAHEPCIGIGGARYGQVEVCGAIDKELPKMRAAVAKCFTATLDRDGGKGRAALRKEVETIGQLVP